MFDNWLMINVSCLVMFTHMADGVGVGYQVVKRMILLGIDWNGHICTER